MLLRVTCDPNVRWLAGHRHRRCVAAGTASALMQRLADGSMTLDELVRSAGDRAAVLPTVDHLMWRQVIDADLAAAVLSGRMTVHAGRRPG